MSNLVEGIGNVFKKIWEVTIEGGDTIEKHENMELVQISKMGEEWWFILRDIPAEELEQMALKAQLDYLSMMVDPEL